MVRLPRDAPTGPAGIHSHYHSHPATHQAAPLHFVGSFCKLEQAVALLSAEMAKAFKRAGRALPPWRTQQAMLSKWAPGQLAQLSSLLSRSAAGTLVPEPTGPSQHQHQHISCSPASIIHHQPPSNSAFPAGSAGTHFHFGTGQQSDVLLACSPISIVRTPSSDLRLMAREVKLHHPRSALAAALGSSSGPPSPGGAAAAAVRTLVDGSSGVRITTVRWGSGTSLKRSSPSQP